MNIRTDTAAQPGSSSIANLNALFNAVPPVAPLPALETLRLLEFVSDERFARVVPHTLPETASVAAQELQLIIALRRMTPTANLLHINAQTLLDALDAQARGDERAMTLLHKRCAELEKLETRGHSLQQEVVDIRLLPKPADMPAATPRVLPLFGAGWRKALGPHDRASYRRKRNMCKKLAVTAFGIAVAGGAAAGASSGQVETLASIISNAATAGIAVVSLQRVSLWRKYRARAVHNRY